MNEDIDPADVRIILRLYVSTAPIGEKPSETASRLRRQRMFWNLHTGHVIATRRLLWRNLARRGVPLEEIFDIEPSRRKDDHRIR